MFAKRLKEARKAKKYSQAEISRMLGVTQQAVGKWETGRSTPDPRRWRVWLKFWTQPPMCCWACKKVLPKPLLWAGMLSAGMRNA